MLDAMEAMNEDLALKMETRLVAKARVMEIKSASIHPMMVIIHMVPALAMAMRNARTLLVKANMALRCIAMAIMIVVLDREMANMPKPGLVTMIVRHTMAPVTEDPATENMVANQFRVKISQDVVLTALNIRRWLIAAALADINIQSSGMIIVVVMAPSITAVAQC